MTDKEFIQICEEADSMAEAARMSGYTYTEFKTRALLLNCYNPNKGKGGTSNLSSYEKLMEILDGKHPTYQPYKLKNLLIKHGLKKNKCEICGITEWNGKPINCQLDHIDGNKFNQALNNLRIICPNCHSQTETFGYKKGRKYNKENQ